MTAEEIVERLERGEVGREIDAEISRHFPNPLYPFTFQIVDRTDSRLEGRFDDGWRMGERRDDKYPYDLPVYTTSLDAAIALVERVRPGWEWMISKSEDVCLAAVEDPDDPVGMIGIQGRAPNPAAALIAALLRAAMLKAEAK